MRTHRYIHAILLLAMLALLSGCLSRVDRATTSYYVLDYKKASENPDLLLTDPFPQSIEVLDAEVNRAYTRSQLVVKDNFSRIRYLPFDLWANRLNDAVPNLIVQRLRAYNIFRNVDRSATDFDSDYYLETKINNLEKIESNRSQAYLNLEFNVRDWATREIVLSHKAERFKDLADPSMVYLVQAYNELLMQETDVLVAKLGLFLNGDPAAGLLPRGKADYLDRLVLTEASIATQESSEGELLLSLNSPSANRIRYSLASLDGVVGDELPYRDDAEFNQEKVLKPGKYIVSTGENLEIQIETEVLPKMRTVVSSEWAELVVKIIDQSQTRIRLPYDLWVKNTDELGFSRYGTGTSLGDDDLGQPDKLWILHPGTYMIRLDGGAWNDLVDFTTVTLNKGDSEVLTLVVDPTGENNLLVGAGILGEEHAAPDRPVVHEGAVHANISLAGNNSAERDASFDSITLTGQLENNIETKFPMSLLTTRSIYDLGITKSTDSEALVSPDDYSLKNVFLFTPWESSETYRNLSFYSRADLQTHFFNNYTYFSQNKNLIMIPVQGDTLVLSGQDRIKTRSNFFPMRLKEGLGLTYRLVLSPKASLSLRTGYGWQQEINNDSYMFSRTGSSQDPQDPLLYDIYVESPNQYYHGIESTLVLSAINILNFLRVNSTLDVLFPMDSADSSPRIESENRFNIKLYRNISLDLKLNVQYDKLMRDWVVYDYGSYLRLSVYY